MGTANITAKEIEQEAKEVRVEREIRGGFPSLFDVFRLVEHYKKANQRSDVRVNYHMIIPH